MSIKDLYIELYYGIKARPGRDCMVVGFTTIYAINAHYH